MQAVILAGGKGTRLRQQLGDLPKPMVDIGGLPLIEHQLLLARRHGFDDFILLLGYGHEFITRWAGDGAQWRVRIRSIVEPAPLGSAGSVLAALPDLDPRFLVMYGDTMLNVDLARFWRAHRESRADVSLLVHPNDHPLDSDLVEADESGRIVSLHPYPHAPGRDYENLVNAALYIVNRDALERLPPSSGAVDFGKHIFPSMLAGGALLYAYRSPEYIKDAGTPERLDSVRADFAGGRIAQGSFETAAAAVFLDRDGTINYEVDRVKTPDELRLLEGAAQAIRRINRSGRRVVIVSNQPVIARGDCTEAELRAIHNRMETLLGREGAYVDAIYYCPHHPDAGFSGERPELKIRCNCRKPATGLVEQACREMNLDLSRSWLVGDSTVDIMTARSAGVRSILVQTGYGGRDARYRVDPDRVAGDLGEAAGIIMAGT